ncbi:MAG TPA: DMT family transporter [bacterium]|nr:DMT family transporter [bacterium]
MAHSDRRAAVPARSGGATLAILYVFLWASAFVPSKILATEAQPLWMLVFRFFAAALILSALALAMRRRLPTTAAAWLEPVLLGALANACYLGLNYVALEHLSSGMGAIIASLNPLILALLAPRLLDEPLSARKALGTALGFGGVVAMMVTRAGTQTARPIDVGLSIAGTVALVFSTVVFKRIQSRHDLLVVNAAQLASASVLLIPAAAMLDGPLRLVVTPGLVASFAYLVLVISVGASLLWFALLARGEASRVSAYYFLTPAFGLALGTILLAEHVALRDVVGLAMITCGIALVQRA